MSSWIIVLGGTPNLAHEELHAIFSSALFVSLSQPCILLEGIADFLPETLQNIAGGVVKIAEVVRKVPVVTAEEFADILITRNANQQKITFGVSRYDGEVASLQFLADIKTQLEQRGKKARFISAKDGILSSVIIQKEHVQELVVAKRENQFLIGLTATVQDFEAWGKRDYGRPYADPKSGMLPPKVARMAVNIAIGATGLGKTILDPFCGMGTILGEALLRGCRVIGSDQSEEVVTKARANLEWLKQTEFELFVSDATHVSEKIAPASIDAIVTEPFMGTTEIGAGKLREPEKIKDIVKGLEKLYIGGLRDWMSVLKPGGKVVIALPQYVLEGKAYFVKKVVDNCENLGYSKILGPIEYGRPQAVVKREFFLFQKKELWHT